MSAVDIGCTLNIDLATRTSQPTATETGLPEFAQWRRDNAEEDFTPEDHLLMVHRQGTSQ